MKNSRTKPPIWLLPSGTELVSFLCVRALPASFAPEEKTLWIQSGLAISPLMGTCLQHFLDFCLWALIGEWTSRVLFPVPERPWPRHGHGALLQNYKCRSSRIVAWARTAFEQGALPSLVLHWSSVSLEIVCSRPRRLWEAIRDLLLFMPVKDPRQVWNDLLPR